MDERTLRILTLMQLPSLGIRRIATLVRTDAVDDLYEHARKFEDLIGPLVVESIESGAARRAAEDVYNEAVAKGQTLLPLGSAEYPPSLAAIYDPPPVLFVRGSLSGGPRRVAVVGARAATAHGTMPRTRHRARPCRERTGGRVWPCAGG